MLKLLKIAVGSAAAIFFADLLGLRYSTAAGIITLLTIQDTSRETIVISVKRIFAFLVATLLSFLVFHLFGYHVFSYGIFLFLFVAVCGPLRLSNAVSTNAVLATHYLLEQSMRPVQIGNEALLLLIGAGIGTLLNLYMPGKGKEIRVMQYQLEEDLRAVLLRMSEYIGKEDKSDYTGSCFDKLQTDIEAGKKQAFAYMNNTFFQESKYFIDYMNMREQQTVVLRDIYKKIISMQTILPQTVQVAELLRETAVTFGESNNAKELLAKREEALLQMKDSELPRTRQEFEDRAVLYGIMTDLEYFLQLKEEFADSLTQEQIGRYWGEAE
ncbi:MAG: aromatic acid exporter family protein [Lachnospiraceae bacterium]|nr:aromatic acid exporter family protein [Lachnospiraceae bacterium]